MQRLPLRHPAFVPRSVRTGIVPGSTGGSVMRLSSTIAAIALSVASVFTSPASAAPLGVSPSLSDGLITQVRGCHRDVERHYVPEFGRRAWHYHRGRNCRPVRVDAPGGGPGVIPGGPGRRDCHRDARRHYLPEYGGSVVHRHVGGSCRVRVLRRSGTFRPGACISIGPVTFCD
jgi:hypothetical protein